MAALTETRIRAAKPKEKPYKLRDGRGLYLLIQPTGSRLWRMRYRYAGRESMLGLGAYPDVTLKMARDRCDNARKQLASGANPAATRRAERTARENTFASLAYEWLSKQQLAPITRRKTDGHFRLILPQLGARPITEIEAPDVLAALRRIESSGHLETAHRVRQRIGQVFRYAIAAGHTKYDPTIALRGALKVPETANHAALTDPAQVGELLRAIDGYHGQPTVRAALQLGALTFLRPGELRKAEWSEFDLDSAEPTWRVPGERMKMKELHIVPLSTQAVSVLRGIQSLTGRGRYVFPSLRSGARPISDNTMNAALRRLGYAGDEMTAHGFRSTASTLLNEQSWHPDLIELQLAHAERNSVRAAYNRAQRLTERRKMMQAWADYLDGLKAGGNVVPIRRPSAAA